VLLGLLEADLALLLGLGSAAGQREVELLCRKLRKHYINAGAAGVGAAGAGAARAGAGAAGQQQQQQQQQRQQQQQAEAEAEGLDDAFGADQAERGGDEGDLEFEVCCCSPSPLTRWCSSMSLQLPLRWSRLAAGLRRFPTAATGPWGILAGFPSPDVPA
jgi:hypothetical protein